ncbi:MAG: pyruvate dehydrogenase (acetyl-transferring), homodimeric type [Deltaproteobacteria bacterium]|nr:pyruvate dehydrogenase (acetyl-transferring), homodimeric type [Deltaproteobacteria bacterium]
MARNGSSGPPPADLIVGDFVASLADAERIGGEALVRRVLDAMAAYAHRRGLTHPSIAQTPFDNAGFALAPYPGDLAVEARIEAALRYNALAMVMRANRESDGLGGHIASYASAATLYEVGFNHFFRGPDDASGGDHLFIQGHVAPGIYARANFEGRLTKEQLDGFRRELSKGGIPSYPHPWLMPDFWQYPTVSMGLGPMNAVRQARFFRYLEDRGLFDRLRAGLTERRGARLWAFLGDGECDEPESLAALSLASREKLDNLVFVVNCNLQRLDGPVRGNGKIVQELEAVFRARGWNVAKVVFSRELTQITDRDPEGRFLQRLSSMVDGELQKCRVEGPHSARKRIAGTDSALLELLSSVPDETLNRVLAGGGHDPVMVHAAYRAAVGHRGGPSCVLAVTTKGYGMGSAGEALNTTHQQKKLKPDELKTFRARFQLALSDAALESLEYATLAPSDLEYLKERRRALGGFLPSRRNRPLRIDLPKDELFAEFDAGTGDREASTTSVLVRIVAKLVQDARLGKYVVPIIPDESRTFGLDALFRKLGIYSAVGQLYEPVDADSLMRYRESKDGQILQEGIDEAGAVASFVAAATSYSSTGVPCVPFYMFYSMFGLQRVGDQIWAAADARARGFLIGGTAGRTTLNGEGLQHQDGHSHVLSQVVPTLRSYDPAFAYELAVIVKRGLSAMFGRDEDVFYYITVGNEPYSQPARPSGVRDEEIEAGAYRILAPAQGDPLVALLGSGAILRSVIEAHRILERYGVSSEVYSVTSWIELRRGALEVERAALLDPGSVKPKSHLERCFGASRAPLFVAASDYMKALPDGIAKWLPAPIVSLGTDGFGHSDTREALRAHFEVDASHVAYYALAGLYRIGELDAATLETARNELGVRS